VTEAESIILSILSDLSKLVVEFH